MERTQGIMNFGWTKMFDGLWYPHSVLQEVAPHLWAYQQRKNGVFLEEKYHWPDQSHPYLQKLYQKWNSKRWYSIFVVFPCYFLAQLVGLVFVILGAIVAMKWAGTLWLYVLFASLMMEQYWINRFHQFLTSPLHSSDSSITLSEGRLFFGNARDGEKTSWSLYANIHDVPVSLFLVRSLWQKPYNRDLPRSLKKRLVFKRNGHAPLVCGFTNEFFILWNELQLLRDTDQGWSIFPGEKDSLG